MVHACAHAHIHAILSVYKQVKFLCGVSKPNQTIQYMHALIIALIVFSVNKELYIIGYHAILSKGNTTRSDDDDRFVVDPNDA